MMTGTKEDDPPADEAPRRYIPAEEWEARRDEWADQEWERLWPDGTIQGCPRCGEEAFEGRSDLTHRITNGRHVLSFRHLHGARCRACDAQSLEPYEQFAVEDEAGVGVRADYEAKVSRIGSGTLGTYWPKDVQRVLGLKPHRRAYIEVVDRDAVLVRFGDVEEG